MAVVLFVCTGNLCRSPSAEGFLSQRLSESGPPEVSVESAGTMGTTMAVPQQLLQEAAAYGLDLSAHVPRRVDIDTVARADLVIGMARAHVREIVVADPPSFSKVFTLREIVRRGAENGERDHLQTLDVWLEEIGAGRRHRALVGESPVDDIADPMGGTSRDYRAMLAEVASLTRTLHSLAWPTSPRQT
jgi:protein-tyrosine phosphatase